MLLLSLLLLCVYLHVFPTCTHPQNHCVQARQGALLQCSSSAPPGRVGRGSTWGMIPQLLEPSCECTTTCACLHVCPCCVCVCACVRVCVHACAHTFVRNRASLAPQHTQDTLDNAVGGTPHNTQHNHCTHVRACRLVHVVCACVCVPVCAHTHRGGYRLSGGTDTKLTRRPVVAWVRCGGLVRPPDAG